MSPSEQLEKARLYAIVDLGYVAEERVETTARELLSGGAGILQLRAKGHPEATILEWAKAIAPICREAGIPFIVNDHIDIARECDADGVHLGQDDGPLATARAQLAEGKLVGRSTHSPEQARAALAEGADYIGFGPLFPTPTKLGRPGIGLENIASVEEEVGAHIPVFCIGGIQQANLPEIKQVGARRVVIVSDLLKSDDIASATRTTVTFLSART
jgi:thiamine-phosphate pyrophosphorylase